MIHPIITVITAITATYWIPVAITFHKIEKVSVSLVDPDAHHGRFPQLISGGFAANTHTAAIQKTDSRAEILNIMIIFNKEYMQRSSQ